MNVYRDDSPIRNPSPEEPMRTHDQARGRYRLTPRRATAITGLLLFALPTGAADRDLEAWLKPQEWKRDGDTPALSLGEKGKFDDQHIFAPHVIVQDGEFWMYYSGSQRCVDAGTYKGRAKDPAHPEKSDQRLFHLGLARSKDEAPFTRHSADPDFHLAADVHSVWP